MKRPTQGGRRIGRVLLASLVLLVAGFLALVRYGYGAETPGQALSLDRIYRLADQGRIVSARLLDEDSEVVGAVCATGLAATPGKGAAASPGAARSSTCPGARATFHATYPRSDVATQSLIDRLAASGPVTVDKQSAKAVAKLLITFVMPLLLLANLFGLILLARGGDTGISQLIGFGGMGRRRQRERAGTGVTFADVAGAEEAVAELKEVTDYLKDPSRFEAVGAAAPKGVLLFGPPGCGKTLLARAVAGESGVPFFSISGAEFVESLVGVGAARVRDLFAQVRSVAPAIVFIDEIDAVGRRREGEGFSGGEREQTLNQLLVELDGFDVRTGIVLMGATNRPDIIDPALMRPGRFDRHVTLDPPHVAGRRAILALHGAGKPLGTDVDLDAVARRTPGFTGADLANVMNEAALLVLRDGHGSVIQQAQLLEALQRVLHGPQRRGRLLSADEQRRLAVHEAGHAVVAAGMGIRAEHQRVSVVARTRSIGSSFMLDDSERVLLTVSQLFGRLTMAMGGLAAEELVLGEASTTSEDDVERATALSREMVGRYGLSPAVGRLRLLARDNGHAGSDLLAEAVSAGTLADFDAEVRRLLDSAEVRARALLGEHEVHLMAVAQRLEAEETLEGAALQRLLDPVHAAPAMEAFPADPADAVSSPAPARRRTRRD